MKGGRYIEDPVIPDEWAFEISGKLKGTFDPLKIEPLSKQWRNS